MTEEQLKEDVKAAHAVFDLCGVRKTNRGTIPLSLKMRALILAGEAGFQLTAEQVSEELKKSNKEIFIEENIKIKNPDKMPGVRM